MSGIFMDGGGHDHIGHGVQVGHGGDGFMDCGHDHGHHGGEGFMADGGHDHGHHMHGGEGSSLSSMLGLHSNHHHNFLSHLLGLDHDAHLHQPHGAPGHVSQMPIWTSALQGMKLSNLFKGLTISANFWMLVMFMGFISWLFVVYWIRHHEPLANAVVGTNSAHSPTASYDRKMMDGIRDAFPLRTSASGGSIYVPIPAESNARGVGAANAFAPSAVPTLIPPPLPLPPPPIAAQPTTQAVMPAYQAYPNAAPYLSAPVVNVPEYGQTGARLKTVVTR